MKDEFRDVNDNSAAVLDAPSLFNLSEQLADTKSFRAKSSKEVGKNGPTDRDIDELLAMLHESNEKLLNKAAKNPWENENTKSMADLFANGEPNKEQLKRLSKALESAHSNGEVRPLVDAINGELEKRGSQFRIGELVAKMYDTGLLTEPYHYEFELLKDSKPIGSHEYKKENPLHDADPDGTRNKWLYQSAHERIGLLTNTEDLKRPLEQLIGRDGKVSRRESFIGKFEEASSSNSVPKLIEDTNKALAERGSSTRINDAIAEPTDNEGEWNYIIEMSNGERMIYKTVKTHTPNANGKFSPPRARAAGRVEK